MKTKEETAKRLDAIATELKELALSLRGEEAMRAEVKKPATPKEGEFWYVRTCRSAEYILCKQGQEHLTSKLYSLRLDINQVSDICKHICSDSDIIELRPATEQEQRQLIKAVEKECNKTFNGKEWVDMKPKFKKGDYISVKLSNAQPVIGIYSELLSRGRDCGMICSYQNFLAIVPHVCNEMYPIDIFSLATEKQKAELDNQLAKVGKRYNPITLELEDIIKEGDLVIAWENNDSAVIGKLHSIDNSEAYPFYLSDGFCFENAIKWDGTKEQYERILRGEEK